MLTSSKRIDIVSDTHGHLSDALRCELVGADLIVHAGDIVSYADYRTLLRIADVKAVLGNNDFDGSCGPAVTRHARFNVDDLVFDVCHFEQRLNPKGANVCIFGHTHLPVLEERAAFQSELEEDEFMSALRGHEESVFAQARKTKASALAATTTLFVNPGSSTFPRGGNGPTMARLWLSNSKIEKAEIIELDR